MYIFTRGTHNSRKKKPIQKKKKNPDRIYLLIFVSISL